MTSISVFSDPIRNGFMPDNDPLFIYLDPRYAPIQAIMEILPNIVFKDTFDAMVLALPDFAQTIAEETNIEVLHALFRDFTILQSVWCLRLVQEEQNATQAITQTARSRIPRQLAIPSTMLGEKLNLHPWLDYYVSTVMYNFRRIDTTLGYTVDNMEMIRPITGTPDERGFFLTHVAISNYSREINSAIQAFYDAQSVDDVRAALPHLQTISRLLTETRVLLRSMHGACLQENFKYFRYLLGGPSRGSNAFPDGVIFEGVSETPRFFTGASGAHDAIFPTLDVFTQLTSAFKYSDLTIQNDLFSECRPPKIRDYISYVKQRSIERDVASFCQSDSLLLLELLKIVQCLADWRYSHYNLVNVYLLGGKTGVLAKSV